VPLTKYRPLVVVLPPPPLRGPSRLTHLTLKHTLRGNFGFTGGLEPCYSCCVETATVTLEGERQTVHLPKGFRLPTPTVSVRHEGDAIVLEPVKSNSWPENFFDSIHITDPTFVRMDQGRLPSVKTL